MTTTVCSFAEPGTGYRCTRLPGHDGPHQAIDSTGTTCATWERPHVCAGCGNEAAGNATWQPGWHCATCLEEATMDLRPGVAGLVVCALAGTVVIGGEQYTPEDAGALADAVEEARLVAMEQRTRAKASAR